MQAAAPPPGAAIGERDCPPRRPRVQVGGMPMSAQRRPGPVRYPDRVNADHRKRKAAPRAATEIAGADTRGLGALLLRARRLERLDQALERALDPRHAPHVRVANVRDGALILATPVAPIATRLRMEAPRLLEALRGQLPAEVSRLEVRVTPDLPARS